MRENFIFYKSFKDAIFTLPEKNQLNILRALIFYALEDTEPVLDGIDLAIFALIRPIINSNNNKYKNGCKGGIYGKKGGAPKGNQNARKQIKTTKNQQNNPIGVENNNPKTTPNDDVDDNENENANENDDGDNCASAQTSSSTVVNNDIELFNALDASGLFTDKEIQQIIDAFSCSTWLRKNITSPQKIAKLKSKIISGYYRDYAETNNDKSQGIITAQMDCSKYETMGFQIITDDD